MLPATRDWTRPAAAFEVGGLNGALACRQVVRDHAEGKQAILASERSWSGSSEDDTMRFSELACSAGIEVHVEVRQLSLVQGWRAP
jgi:hypothetical protein